MVKLLRFRSNPTLDATQYNLSNQPVANTDLHGYGKQSIVIPAHSKIAIKNYNIQLQSTPQNSTYSISRTGNTFQFGLTGDSQVATIQSGTYNIDDLCTALANACNLVTGQTPSLTTTVSYLPGGTLVFSTTSYPLHAFNRLFPAQVTASVKSSHLSSVTSGFKVLHSLYLPSFHGLLFPVGLAFIEGS